MLQYLPDDIASVQKQFSRPKTTTTTRTTTPIRRTLPTIKPTTYYSAPRTAREAPQVTVAKIGDDYPSLATKVGADPLEMARVNDGAPVQAGAAYTVPSKPLASQVAGGGDSEEPSFWEKVGMGLQYGADYLAQDATELWQSVTPQDEAAGETFYDWAHAEPGEVGDSGWFMDNIVRPVSRWWDKWFGIDYGGQSALPPGVGTGAGAMWGGQPLPTTIPDWLKPTDELRQQYSASARAASQPSDYTLSQMIPGWGEQTSQPYTSYRAGGSVAADMRASGELQNPWQGPNLMSGTTSPFGNYGGGRFQDSGFTPLDPGPPGPRMGHEFTTVPGGTDLFGGIGEQYMDSMVTPGEQREMRDERYRHFAGPDLYDSQVDVLRGLTRLKAEGDTQGLLDAGAHPWAKQFTVNWLNSHEGADVYVGSDGEIQGVIDWDNVPEGTVEQLVDLGYLEKPGQIGGYGGSGGYGGKYHYPGMSYYGNQLGDYKRPANLGLVSWSI